MLTVVVAMQVLDLDFGSYLGFGPWDLELAVGAKYDLGPIHAIGRNSLSFAPARRQSDSALLQMGPTSTAPGAIELAGAASAPGLSGARSPWVRGPVWDSFWMLSALWLAPIVLWLAYDYADPASSPLDLLYFGLTALFWLGHRFSSTYMAYCTEAYRPLLRTQPIRFVVLPVLITIGCFAFFLPGDLALPWTRAERLIGLVLIDYAWVTWHFASQHFGALSLYRSRAGRAGCEQTRRFDRFFALVVGGALVLVADILAGAVAYQDKWIDHWFFPPGWCRRKIPSAMALPLCSSSSRSSRFLRSCAQHDGRCRASCTFSASRSWWGSRCGREACFFLSSSGLRSTGLLPRGWRRKHCGASRLRVVGLIRGALHGLNIRPWAVVLFLAVVSILLLPIFEVEANRQPGTYYGDRIFGAFAASLRTSVWMPMLVALGFATGFIHYLLDRSVYRMSDPQVRVAARGLLERRARTSNAGE